LPSISLWPQAPNRPIALLDLAIETPAVVLSTLAPVTPAEDNPDIPDAPAFGPLPIEPDFPVYALGPRFTGRRWLVSWTPLVPRVGVPVDSDNPLVKVNLGFGNQPPAPEIRVVTIAKRQRVWSGGLGFGPTGYRDAALEAVLSALDIWNSYRDKDHRPPLSDEVQHWSEVADDEGAEWQDKMVEVGGIRTPARFVTMGETDGVVIDLGQVAVAVVGKGHLLDEYGLEVVADLASYRPLSN